MTRLVVLSADPGISTGWALHVVRARDLLRLGQVGAMRMTWWRNGTLREGSTGANVDAFLDLARVAYEERMEEGDVLVMVSERFTLLMNSTDPDLLEPVRFNAILEDRLRGSEQFIEWGQGPSDAKHITDAQLGLWGVYKPGPAHHRDAQKHGLVFMRRWASQPKLRERTGWAG